MQYLKLLLLPTTLKTAHIILNDPMRCSLRFGLSELQLALISIAYTQGGKSQLNGMPMDIQSECTWPKREGIQFTLPLYMGG